jgi:hypothetical protein
LVKLYQESALLRENDWVLRVLSVVARHAEKLKVPAVVRSTSRERLDVIDSSVLAQRDATDRATVFLKASNVSDVGRRVGAICSQYSGASSLASCRALIWICGRPAIGCLSRFLRMGQIVSLAESGVMVWLGVVATPLANLDFLRVRQPVAPVAAAPAFRIGDTPLATFIKHMLPIDLIVGLLNRMSTSHARQTRGEPLHEVAALTGLAGEVARQPASSSLGSRDDRSGVGIIDHFAIQPQGGF